VARGGRYDDIGAAFGRARPACGFSSDLKLLMRLNKTMEQISNNGIFAPWSDDPKQHQAVEQLRKEGKMVVMGLPGQDGSAEDMGCNELLLLQDGEWVVTAA
jgi:ATP phosphoribosyltransferase regulatory subunit